MIQLNLLPDVKLEYIKAQRQRRLIFSISAIATITAVVILVSLLLVSGLQKKHLSDLSQDIDTESRQLKGKPDINKILTVQNQLDSLTKLHDGKPAVTRLFGYLNQVTPAQVSITNFDVDFTAQTATITGTADALSSVNKYVDTLKFTTYTDKSNPDNKEARAFSNIVLASFSVEQDNEGSSANQADYSITFNYDPLIFDITSEVKLVVPSTTTTRSNIESSNLFQAAPAATNQEKAN